jgi:hypothetical protein
MNRTGCTSSSLALRWPSPPLLFAADTAYIKKNYGDRYNVLSERNIFMTSAAACQALHPAQMIRHRALCSKPLRPPGIVLEEGSIALRRRRLERASSFGGRRRHARGHVLEIEIDASHKRWRAGT